MSPLDITEADYGRTVDIETKTKSRPNRGVLLQHIVVGNVVRLQLQQTYGTKWYTLTDLNTVEIYD